MGGERGPYLTQGQGPILEAVTQFPKSFPRYTQ
jgi:hypothetical protein